MEDSRQNIFVARQPIFTRNKKVFAYELLFRSGLHNYFDPSQNGEEATSHIITSSFLLIGISVITEEKRAFINFSEEMLLEGYPQLFPKKLVTVEVLETVSPSPRVVAACEQLKEAGYLLALDDFLYDDSLLPLIKLAGIIKFDVRQMSLAELKRQVAIVRQYKVKILAEKVESNEEFEALLDMGFDLFQGYFFSRPHIMKGRDIPGSRFHYLKLLRLLQDENSEIADLAALVSRDVSLAYKLLKYVNSPYFARRNKVENIEMAVAMLGQLNLRKWLSLMMLSYLSEDKPSELLRLAAFRGCFCELLTEALPEMQRNDQGLSYSVGMFSLLPAILDLSMGEILNELALPDLLTDALLARGQSSLASVLAMVNSYEQGHWEEAAALAGRLGLDFSSLPSIYSRAIELSGVQLYG